MTEPILCDVFEAADKLRMLPARLKRLAKAGDVPCVKLPDAELRFEPAALQRWIEQFRQEESQ